MRAMVYRGPYKVRVEEKDIPPIEHPNDAIVRVTLAAICGSDLHLYHGMMPDTRVGMTFGQEFIGVVEQVGSSVEKLSPGDRVMVPFNICCGSCWFCKRGLYSNCHNTNPNASAVGGIYGYSHTTGGYDGGQSQYVRVPFADVGPTKIPDWMDDEDAVLLTDACPTELDVRVVEAVHGDRGHRHPARAQRLGQAGGERRLACARRSGVPRSTRSCAATNSSIRGTSRHEGPPSVGVFGPDGEDGTRGVQEDALGVAAEQRLANGGATVDAHDEQFGADLLRNAQDGIGGRLGADVQVPDPVGHALAGQPRSEGVEVALIGGSGPGVAGRVDDVHDDDVGLPPQRLAGRLGHGQVSGGVGHVAHDDGHGHASPGCLTRRPPP
jgi:hypothetical protein